MCYGCILCEAMLNFHHGQGPLAESSSSASAQPFPGTNSISGQSGEGALAHSGVIKEMVSTHLFTWTMWVGLPPHLHSKLSPTYHKNLSPQTNRSVMGNFDFCQVTSVNCVFDKKLRVQHCSMKPKRSCCDSRLLKTATMRPKSEVPIWVAPAIEKPSD